MTSWKNKLRSKRICCHYQCHHLLKANCSTKVFASMVSLWELHEACFWQGWDWEGSLALALAARWLTCLVQHPLFLKNSSSEFPLFLKWVTMGSNPTPSTPWCCVLPYDHIRFAPWRLWTLMFYFVSLCHCELGKESSLRRSTTCNFLHCFQISGPMDSTAFLVISLPWFWIV